MTSMTSGMITIISNKGYSIEKDKLEEHAQMRKIKDDLTVTPIGHPEFPAIPSFSVLYETAKYLRLPVWYATQRFGHPTSILAKDKHRDLCFEGSLRDYQMEPVAKAVYHLKEHGRGILCLVTGGGKSICALNIACDLKQKTLIIVHKRSLMEQWRDEILKVIPNATIGIFCQKQMEIDDTYDVTIAMWHTVLKRNGIPPNWGMVIIDECHRVCSKEFSTIMFKVNAKYVLGLTATPERKDGLENVLYWHLGELIYKQPPVQRSQAKTLVWVCQYYEPSYVNITVSGRNYTRILSHIVQSESRNEYIMQVLQKIMGREDANERKILILTDRVQHAKTIYMSVSSSIKDDKTVGLFVGEVKTAQLIEAKKSDIIVATYKIFEEGENVEDLNTLILATPKKCITQALGRIFRKRHDVCPLVVDIADTLFRGQMKSRMAIYRHETKGHLSTTYFNEHHENLRERGHSKQWQMTLEDMT